jgi:hypothetical protein
MVEAWLANAVLALHGAFVLWVGLGVIAVRRWPGLAWVHLPAVAWGVWIEWTGAICPLTPLEQRLRRAAGQQGYDGGFIEHYLMAAIYPEGLTPQIQWAIGAGILLLNACAYAALWRRRARRTAGRGLA